MSDQYGSDYLSIVDDSGKEYEFEVLNTIEYNGSTYLAVVPADIDTADPGNLQVYIVKSVEEDGEPILYVVDSEDELNAVNDLIMDSIFADPSED